MTMGHGGNGEADELVDAPMELATKASVDALADDIRVLKAQGVRTAEELSRLIGVSADTRLLQVKHFELGKRDLAELRRELNNKLDQLLLMVPRLARRKEETEP